MKQSMVINYRIRHIVTAKIVDKIKHVLDRPDVISCIGEIIFEELLHYEKGKDQFKDEIIDAYQKALIDFHQVITAPIPILVKEATDE